MCQTFKSVADGVLGGFVPRERGKGQSSWEGTAEPAGRGCPSHRHTAESSWKRKGTNIERIDCCDFGSGAENGKEELKKMN